MTLQEHFSFEMGWTLLAHCSSSTHGSFSLHIEKCRTFSSAQMNLTFPRKDQGQNFPGHPRPTSIRGLYQHPRSIPATLCHPPCFFALPCGLHLWSSAAATVPPSSSPPPPQPLPPLTAVAIARRSSECLPLVESALLAFQCSGGRVTRVLSEIAKYILSSGQNTRR